MNEPEGLKKFIKEQKAQEQVAVNQSSEAQETISNAQQREEISTLLAQVKAEKKKRAEAEQERNQAVKTNTRLQKQLEARDNQIQAKAMDAIIQGDSDNFKKHYRFSIEGQADLEFDIELRPASAADLAAIDADVAQQTAGMATFLPASDIDFFTAISLFKKVGVKVPEPLKDPKQVYRLDIPLAIYADYKDWLESFRNKVQY